MRASACIGRVGGLAAVLGIGAVIGGFGLGIASASPDDSPEVDSATAASSSSRQSESSRGVRTAQEAGSRPAAASARSGTAARAASEQLDVYAATAHPNSSSASLPAKAATSPNLAPAFPERVRLLLVTESTEPVPIGALESVTATAPQSAEPLAAAPESITDDSSQPAAAMSLVEPAVSSQPDSDPFGPVALPLAWTALAASRRERGSYPAPQWISTSPVSNGEWTDSEPVLAAAAMLVADHDLTQMVNPQAAEMASNPITAIIEQIQFVVNFATAIVQFVVNQIVQTVVQAAMSIVNVFAPGTTATITETITLNEPSWTQGHLLVSPDSERLYMPLTQYRGVAVIDIDPTSATRNTVTSILGADNGVWSFADAAITPDGKRLFLVNRYEDSVLTLALDPGDSEASYASIDLRSSPQAVAISADGTRAYVTYIKDGSKVAVINTATNTVVGTVALVGDPNPDYDLPAGYQIDWYQPENIELSPNGTRAYVIAMSGVGSKVLVIDTARLSVVASVRVGVDPLDLVASPDGRRIYVANLNSSSVSVIDTATNTVISSIAVGFPETVAISPDGRKLFVASWVTTSPNYASTYSVSVIDTATQIVTARITIDGQVADMVVSPDGQRLYITATGAATGTSEPAAKILVLDV